MWRFMCARCACAFINGTLLVHLEVEANTLGVSEKEKRLIRNERDWCPAAKAVQSDFALVAVGQFAQ